ncbi:LysM peptidoglycan-binding domain-containing protein [Sporolactobacillus nakayamae]|uniref:Stage VI sporulation protein D n=1 Tax=Sporolactobacillus nakayamae TaxID=269670 RepID=A0A1I2NRU8_9BACL|nr:LysM peptidoglycan-binding domain-containing protein [Sporolactobacillus nakayamae]SFG05730.1 stage VI sporulation protein D [Sporolactobacillus nakayamae]
MSQTSNDRLQFSINESVWLKNDAPAEEILSMALEPDITVEENWNDVTIKGYLRLTGEYKPADVPDAAVDSEHNAAPFRTIDEIMETGNGTDTLEHHFPIDITIPADRVPNLEDLFVVIDSFDYELSEHRHIQLQADIAITGLTNNNPVDRTEKPKAKPPVEQPAATPAKPEKAKETAPAQKPAAKAPAKKEEKPIKPEKSVKAQKEEKPVKPLKAQKEEKPEKPVKAQKEDKPEKPVAKKFAEPAPKSKAAEDPAKKEAAKNVQKPASKGKRILGEKQPISGEFEEMPTDRLNDEEDVDFHYEAFRKPDDETNADGSPLVAFKGMAQDGSQNTGRSETTTPAAPQAAPSPVAAPQVEATPSSEESEQEQVPDSGKKDSDMTSLYLTKVLSGDEKEQKTRVKICIVQSGESLESISERYHVPVTSLLRKNALTSGEIEAGELLYIPKSTKAAKDES